MNGSDVVGRPRADGYLSPTAVFIDGTHIKANANNERKIREEVPAASKRYAKELMKEINAERETHDKKPFPDDNDNNIPPKASKPGKNTSKKKLACRKKMKTVTKVRPTPKADILSRETIKDSLPMKLTQPATSTDLSLKP